MSNKQSTRLPNAIKFTLSQFTEWKKTLLGQASAVFDKGKTHTAQEAHNKRKKEQLYKHIGQLKVDVDFIKDSCEKLGVPLPQKYHN